MKILLFYSFLLLISCSSRADYNMSQDKAEMSDSISTTDETDFVKYWDNFCKALRDSDSVALNILLDEKVSFYGKDDANPRFDLTDNDRVIKVLEIYNKWGYYDDKEDRSVSYKDFFARKEIPSEYIKGKQEQQIHDFVFRKNSKGIWKLFLVYYTL